MADQSRAHLQNAQTSVDKVTTAVNRCSINLEDVRELIKLSAQQDTDGIETHSASYQQALSNLEFDLVNLHQAVDDLPSQISSLGMSSFMNSLPAIPVNLNQEESSQEYANLYDQLISAYSSHERYRDYCTTAWNLINQSQSKRSFNRILAIPRMSSGRAFYMEENLHLMIEKYVKNLAALLPGLACVTHSLLGTGTVIEIVVDRIFRAIILLRGFTIEAVNVRSADEYFNLEAQALRPKDLWSPSICETYRIVAANASSAVLHFCNPLAPEMSLKAYLQWLNSFASLFSSPCKKCGKYLDQGLPATWRDYKRFDPYHDSCRGIAITPM